MLKQLWQVYQRGFAPPAWILDMNLEDEMKETICYYDFKDNLEIVKSVEKFREPVNIGMSRMYSKQKLNALFGYETSVYNPTSPNIAVYCYTPCIVGDKTRNIHVLNVIGVALDSQNQPDYIRILENGKDEYFRMVYLVFKKIKHCFLTKPFQYLVLHGFGLGAFSSLAKNFDIDPQKVFVSCLENLLNDLPKDKKIIINYLDIQTKLKVMKINVPIQKLVFNINPDKLSKTLFINAWDPFSVIGNGNSKDPTLDGYFGRMTAMSVLGWSLTNPYVKFEAVL